MLWPGAELIVDGGVRQKKQQAGFFGTFFDPAAPDPRSYVEATLTTTSVTPRVKFDSAIFGMPLRSISGVDWYNAQYESPRSLALGDAPFHRYDLTQMSMAAYTQQTLTILQNTDFAIGGRIQRTGIKARDGFDINAPGACPFFFCGDPQGIPLDKEETNRAYHIGLEHRITPQLTAFGRTAQSFRVPNVDERVGMVSAGIGDPTTFALKTQRSRDWEVGGRVNVGSGEGAIEHLRHVPDRRNSLPLRSGLCCQQHEPRSDRGAMAARQSQAGKRPKRCVLRGGYAYTRAVFREGIFAGNDVPLVSRNTASVGVAWNIFDRRLVFDGVVRYVGSRRYG